MLCWDRRERSFVGRGEGNVPEAHIFAEHFVQFRKGRRVALVLQRTHRFCPSATGSMVSIREKA